MKKNRFVMIVIMFLLNGCASITPPSATQTGHRAVILDNENYSEEDFGGFTSWYCRDFIHEYKGILLELGYFNDLQFSGVGFVLYDGGYTGEPASYRRTGLEHRWDWGESNEDSNANYSFIIKVDGTGLYYDFTGVPEGESIKARDVFKCYKR